LQVKNTDWILKVGARECQEDLTNNALSTQSYDAAGNRIFKQINGGATTLYVRDASGDVMSVYEGANASSLKQTEVHLYGSSRLGIAGGAPQIPELLTLAGDFTAAKVVEVKRGEKFFEWSNHLGNVLATVSDRKIAHSSNSSMIDYYTADVISAQDYYPFGMIMPGRVSSNQNVYRYGFNGKETDRETGSTTTYDYGFRIYNPALCRFLSVDPLSPKYAWYTPYQFAGNKPIKFVDVDGLEDGLEMRTRRMEEGYLQGKVTDRQLHAYYTAQGVGAAMGVGILLTRGAILKYGPQLYNWATFSGIWMSNPSNVQTVQNTTGFVISILNPDPNNTGLDFPGVGDDFGKTINLSLRTKAGKIVQFFGTKTSKFENTSERNWALKLLNEGNNVVIMAKDNVNKTYDILVNGAKWELKELSKMEVGQNFQRNLVNKFYDGLKQAPNVLIDGVNQKGFTREAAQEALNEVKRKGVKEDATFRIVGKDFEFVETIKAPKK
jgi:RHS repeat-associated protein